MIASIVKNPSYFVWRHKYSKWECARNLSNSNWTEWSTIQGVIVSITKFSIVIGHPRAVTWVSNYSYPIKTFCNRIAVIGHPCCTHVNQLQLNGFFFAVFLLLSN